MWRRRRKRERREMKRSWRTKIEKEETGYNRALMLFSCQQNTSYIFSIYTPLNFYPSPCIRSKEPKI